MQRISSIQALRAIEAFARLGAVKKVAEELNLTRSAVSHQLRLLERDLKIPLFDRVGTRIVLSSRGHAFANDVRVGLSLINASAARHAGRDLSGQLIVSCTPGFAASWLSPKIERFRASCPDVALSIITPKRLDDVSNPNADLFIVFAEERSLAGAEVELLKNVEFTPLLSPVLSNRIGGVQKPEDVQRCDLLHLGDRADWNTWLQLAGLPTARVRSGVVFADMNLVYNAAINAQGIALGDEFICKEAMATGQLVRPFELAINSPKSYFLSIPPAKANIASVVAFRQWLLDELPETRA